MNPLVSVVIPNYNHSDFLKERIESVINQSYTHFEIILLDDKSTDDSRTLIETYRGHPNVKAISYNEVNSGSTFKQWVKGIALSSGDYIWIAESDDIARSNFLQEMVTRIMEDQKRVIGYCESVSSHEAFAVATESSESPAIAYDGRSFVAEYMLTSPAIVNASAVIFKRKAVDDYILTEIIKYKYSGDWLFWSYLATKGEVIYYPVQLNFFRRPENSVAFQGEKNGWFVKEGLQIILFVKRQLNIGISFRILLIWGSVWAQNAIIRADSGTSLLKYNLGTSLSISPLLPFTYAYFYIKFRWFSPIVIKK